MTQFSSSSKVPGVDVALLERAQGGDRRAFDRLFAEHLPKLRGVIYRMVGHPDDVDELSQQALLKAFEGLKNFRGESTASTWLCSIGARLAIDHLRQRRRWREQAQSIFGNFAHTDPEIGGQVGATFSDPDFSYDVGEHIAYCFTCVGRSLEPELHAALVLRDVLELKNEEAAIALGMSLSTFRHRLSDARGQMQKTYEGLCALVNKEGICWQCSGLRDAAPEGRKGPDVPTSVDWAGRLRLVRMAALSERKAGAMHDVFFRLTETQEQEGRGDESMMTECGKPAHAKNE